MPVVPNITSSWSDQISVVENEIWQCKAGTAALTTEASPSDDDGILLKGYSGHAVTISAGRSVRIRSVSREPAVVVREAF